MEESGSDVMADLLALMARLRDPDGGCPWDLVQTYESIAPHTIEEAYEVADAVHHGDMEALKDELGDLLFQVVFHAQMAAEQGAFTFADVAAHVTRKMIHRHPHVFGEEKAASAGDVEKRIWEERKAAEARKQGMESILDDVPVTLPSVLRAQKLQKRAARVGFEWEKAADVLDKLEEEISEMREAAAEHDKAHMEEELGDVLFCVINYARMLGIDSDAALRGVNYKFERRFRVIESGLKAQGIRPEDATLEQMERLWQEAKAGEHL